MGASRGFSDFLDKVRGLVGACRPRESFTCGDCSQWEHCGLPPSDDCIAKAAQLEERARRSPMRDSLLGWGDVPAAKP